MDGTANPSPDLVLGRGLCSRPQRTERLQLCSSSEALASCQYAVRDPFHIGYRVPVQLADGQHVEVETLSNFSRCAAGSFKLLLWFSRFIQSAESLSVDICALFPNPKGFRIGSKKGAKFDAVLAAFSGYKE